MIKSFEDKPTQKMGTCKSGMLAFARTMMDALLSGRAKQKPKMPRGLGGYELRHIGVEILDPRQKTGVKIWRAMLIEKNKYAPRYRARSQA